MTPAPSDTGWHKAFIPGNIVCITERHEKLVPAEGTAWSRCSRWNLTSESLKHQLNDTFLTLMSVFSLQNSFFFTKVQNSELLLNIKDRRRDVNHVQTGCRLSIWLLVTGS